MDEKTGVSGTGPSFRLSKPLGKTTTIYHAIEICVQECLKGASEVQKSVYYQITKQVTLHNNTCKSKLTCNCKQSLR